MACRAMTNCPGVTREELQAMLEVSDEEMDTAIDRLEELHLIELCDCIPPHWLTKAVLMLWA